MGGRKGGLPPAVRSLFIVVAAALLVLGGAAGALKLLSDRFPKGDSDRTGADRKDLARVQARPSGRSVKPPARPPAAKEMEEIVHEEVDEGIPPMASAGESAEASSRAAPSSGLRAEYEGRKAKAPGTSDGQTRLARWCEEHGLKDEAKAHWEAVTRINPGDDSAWKHLGYKKRGPRWVTDAMLAEEAAQEKADKAWKKPLDDLHKRMHGKGPDAPQRRTDAEAELAKVDDPRSAPMLWKVFAGDVRHHVLLSRVLGGLKSPRGSRMLAALAI